MRKKGGVGILLLVISVVMMIYKSETSYQYLGAGAKWARSFGAGFAPWMLGLVVAAIKEAWARGRKQSHSFAKSTLWATGAFTVLLVVATVFGSARGQDRQALRDDAMLLMGVSVWVPGVAAYCNKYVEPNEQLLSAAKAWNQRHSKELETVVQVIKWTGRLSKIEKELIDRMAFKMLKQEVDAQQDRQNYCREIGQVLDRGILDLATREDTAPALRRIMALNLK